MATKSPGQKPGVRENLVGGRNLRLGISGHDPQPLTPEFVEYMNVYTQGMFLALNQAREHMRENRLEAARQVLLLRLQSAPDNIAIYPTLADVLFRQGRNTEAYNLLGPEVGPNAEQELMMRASYAAALRGEVYPGQREYCKGILLSRYQGAEVTDVASYVPQGSSPYNVATVSLLAIGATENSDGEHNALYYMGKALARDPGNPLACHTIGMIHFRHLRWVQAASALEAGLPRASGFLREAMELWLERARHYREHGYPG